MNNETIHPLDDPNITWLNPQQVADIRGLDINQKQLEREERAQREHHKKASWILSDKDKQ